MLQIRRDAEIHAEEGGWFAARWHFSFDRYRDPEQMGIGPLRVFNDDRLVAGADWPMHPHADVEGRIVLIPQADPGYDWLLARGIAGLSTMFGGANSHMAVRAAECSLPAAIGVGETRYEQLAHASVLRLDCGARTISVVR